MTIKPSGTTCLFVLSIVILAGTNLHAQPVYKCVSNGKTVYSESPCAAGNHQGGRMPLNDDKMGNVIPENRSIASPSLHSQKREQTSGGTMVTRRTNDSTCNALYQELKLLNSRSRLGLSDWERVEFDKERQDISRQLSGWRC